MIPKSELEFAFQTGTDGNEDGQKRGERMYKGLIDNLAFVYGFIARGREKMTDEERRSIANGSHTMVSRARDVLGREDETAQDRADLELARRMDDHIEDSVVFLQHLEIV